MSWLALPYSEAGFKEQLLVRYSVEGIPTLVLIDGKKGIAISRDDHTVVQRDPNGAQLLLVARSGGKIRVFCEWTPTNQ